MWRCHCTDVSHLIELRLGIVEAGFVAAALALHLIAIDARDHHPFLDVGALIHVQLDQLAGNFEGDVHLRQLEIAGNAQRVGVGRMQTTVDVIPRYGGDGDDDNNWENDFAS